MPRTVPGRLMRHPAAGAAPSALVDHLEVADGFLSRLIGWQGRRRPAMGAGLLLVPCPSVHTCCVRFPLDVVCLDPQGRVVDVRHAVRPWRIVQPQARTFAVLELPAAETAMEIGDAVRYEPPSGAAAQRSLKFLLSPPAPNEET